MSGRGQADLDKAAPIKWRYMIGDKAVTGSLRTAICVLAMLSVIACAVNLAPAGDVLLAGTEDERDNVLGRLLNERGPILLFSQRSRRELETESARPPDKRANGDAIGALIGSPRALSSIAGAVRKTVERIRGRLTGRPALPAPVFAIEKSISADDLRVVRDSAAPLIVGPWSSEVGFESCIGFRSCGGLRASTTSILRESSPYHAVAHCRGTPMWPHVSLTCSNL